MPIKSGKRTPKEQIFADAFARTGDRAYAMHAAGLSASGASRALDRPEIQEDVRRVQLARLHNELLPAAIDLLGAVIVNKDETTRNRITAAKLIMDRTLGDKEAGEAKADHELTGAELAASIARGRAALGILIERQSTIEHDAEEVYEVHVPSAFD